MPSHCRAQQGKKMALHIIYATLFLALHKKETPLNHFLSLIFVFPHKNKLSKVVNNDQTD